MHIAIVSAFAYPDGGPAATRHLALAAGLAEAGSRVTFILLRQGVPEPAPLTADGVAWASVPASRLRSPLGWRAAVWRELTDELGEVHRASPVDAVLLVDRDPFVFSAGLRAARRARLPVLHEITEYPDVVRRPGPLGALSLMVFERHHLRAVDGVLVISRALRDYAAQRTSAPIHVLGALVDVTSTPVMPPLALTDTLSVGYAGSLSQKKDGVLTLVRAAAAAAKLTDVTIRLEIVGGDVRSADGREASLLCRELRLENVTFHGQLPQADVAGRLSRCHVLVLPRPASRQATGGFPTKLGEYLASGRPVITTAVGDIPRHLADHETCLMVAPGDVDALARALVAVASDYEAARAIGGRGRELVEASFAASRQARALNDFVESVKKARA